MAFEGAQPGSGYQDLVAQVKSLSHQLDTLRRGKQTGPRSFRGPCWECGKPGHVRRNCPQRRRDQTTRDRGDRSVHFTSAVACTLTLQGAVEGHPTVMLVDTGSSVTILHENIWKKAVKGKKELKQATCPVMAVNRESLPLCGQAEVTLQVGSYSGVHKVLVVRDMTQQCLLGTDFLEQCHCVINMGTITLTMAGVKQQVPLLGGEGVLHVTWLYNKLLLFLPFTKSGFQSALRQIVTYLRMVGDCLNLNPYFLTIILVYWLLTQCLMFRHKGTPLYS